MTYYYNGKPYVPDIDMWRKHFVDMANGLVHPDENGRYREKIKIQDVLT
jgi:hypothetical protein